MELTESRWIRPTKPGGASVGRIVLMPPTLKTVEELRDFSGIEALKEAARSRKMKRSHRGLRSEKGYGRPLHDPEYSREP